MFLITQKIKQINRYKLTSNRPSSAKYLPCCPELKPQMTGGFAPEPLVTTTLSTAVPAATPALVAQDPIVAAAAVESGFATTLTS
jgi:hypothetical protein